MTPLSFNLKSWQMPSIWELIRMESLISQFGPKEAFSKLEIGQSWKMAKKTEYLGSFSKFTQKIIKVKTQSWWTNYTGTKKTGEKWTLKVHVRSVCFIMQHKLIWWRAIYKCVYE